LTRFTSRAEFEEVVWTARTFRDAHFRFAKSMPKIPHWYTLIRDWTDRQAFMTCMDRITKYGYETRFFRSVYTYLDIEGFHHWFMPEDLVKPNLINRAVKKYPRLRYDGFGSPSNSVTEAVATRFKSMSLGKTLEIGIPDTGCLLDIVGPIPDYCCIEIRDNVREAAIARHPSYKDRFIRSCISDYYDLGFKTIVALFGSASQMPADSEQRIRWMLDPDGQAILMYERSHPKPLTPRLGMSAFEVRKIKSGDE
jgi:hypothetical protein